MRYLENSVLCVLKDFWQIHGREVQNLQNTPLLRWLFGLVYERCKKFKA